jgi:hypothetical protein
MMARLAKSGLAWSVAVSLALSVWILIGLNGQQYYMTPLATRGYAPGHKLLRPSGAVGQTLGMAGASMMLMPFFYMLRKRVKALKGAGTLKGWLEAHLFCGVVGPLLITFHTSFKFNGIVSAAYWSMVIVVLSGFVGRYLYVRIPRSIRGHELTRAELDARAEELRVELAETLTSPAAFARLDGFERQLQGKRPSLIGVFVGDLGLARRLRSLDRDLARAGLSDEARATAQRLASERSILLRRLAYLQRTKQLFELWHVFHLPLVYLMLVIVVAHVGVTLYMGYVPFRW